MRESVLCRILITSTGSPIISPAKRTIIVRLYTAPCSFLFADWSTFLPRLSRLYHTRLRRP